ncbi:NAD(P)H-hydrate dehydratase [Paracoccus sp. p4-l81]|uniref:NAD(P)H-hydrate dehydratase n=1 Tax=unclassified Paracoccus (in: a-proteobacteria) TaxID=2688777 RepID=UPI0035BB0AAD
MTWHNEILTCAQMRAVEQAAIAKGAVTGLELMERAGAGVVGAIETKWPQLFTPPERADLRSRAVVLCGPGNNGGDGYVVARLLANRGWDVQVYALGDPARLPADARTNHDRWRAIGPVTPLIPDRAFFQCDVLVDALFGTGGRGMLTGLDGLLMAIEEAAGNIFCGPNSPGIDHIVAVDVPSWLDADTGQARNDYCPVVSDLTVTFHTAKPGHYLAEGPELCGDLAVVELGLFNAPLAQHPDPSLRRPIYLATANRHRLSKTEGHKYDHGHALILSGGPGRGGAARMAARAALRIGAGLVTLACPGAALTENAARLDAVMLREVDTADTLAALLDDRRITALALGPGLGLDRARDLLPIALAARRATVLDADALTAFADAPDRLFAALHPDCVLTPHAGEFARLFPDLNLCDSLAATRAAAARAGCTVLLKGPATIIAAPDGATQINAAVYADAAPWLATAGSGDVLAGIITGLLARGCPVSEAAAQGAWMHAAAARAFGPGLIAEDLPDQIPAVLRALGL